MRERERGRERERERGREREGEREKERQREGERRREREKERQRERERGRERKRGRERGMESSPSSALAAAWLAFRLGHGVSADNAKAPRGTLTNALCIIYTPSFKSVRHNCESCIHLQQGEG